MPYIELRNKISLFIKKFVKKNFIILLAIIFFYNNLSNAFSAQLPRFLGSERKFRSFVYNPNELYRYFGHYTYQGFIEFEAGELINTISMGNPTLWLVETLDNRLFLKPVGEDNSETNMTVLTNKRVYHFELVAKEAKGISDKDLIFVVKFSYPDEKDKNIVEFQRAIPSDEPDLRDLSVYNFNYQYTGEKSIAPSKVFDDGVFTYFQFLSKNSEVPAIYSVDSEGYESLVNFRVAGTYIIVEKVAPQYTLRNGNDIVCVYNMQTYMNGVSRQSTLKPNSKNERPPMQNFGNDMPAFQNIQPMEPSISMPQMPNGMEAPMNPMPPMLGDENPNAMPPFMMDGSMPNPLMQKKSARSRALGLPF